MAENKYVPVFYAARAKLQPKTQKNKTPDTAVPRFSLLPFHVIVSLRRNIRWVMTQSRIILSCRMILGIMSRVVQRNHHNVTQS
jgi:hypothetical protein